MSSNDEDTHTRISQKEAARVRAYMDRATDGLDVDAKSLGVKLTESQKTYIVRRLKKIVRKGTDREKLKESLRKKTRELITTLTRA